MDIAILLDNKFFNLFVLTITLALSGLAMWFMYTKLAKKDLFTISKPKKESSKFGKFICNTAYISKYILFLPLYSFLWFIVFSFILLILSKSQNPESILYFCIVIISAIRVCAYLNEKLAEDMAKLLPLTMVATVIINPNFLSLDLETIINMFTLNTSNIIPLLPSYIKLLLFTIILEWILRIISTIANAIKNKKSKKFDVPSYK
jgi:hypothetical protein